MAVLNSDIKQKKKFLQMALAGRVDIRSRVYVFIQTDNGYEFEGKECSKEQHKEFCDKALSAQIITLNNAIGCEPLDEYRPEEAEPQQGATAPLIESNKKIERSSMIRPETEEFKPVPAKKTFNMLGEIKEQMEKDKARAQKMNLFAKGYNKLNH
jgi:hypothetical protein